MNVFGKGKGPIYFQPAATCMIKCKKIYLYPFVMTFGLFQLPKPRA